MALLHGSAEGRTAPFPSQATRRVCVTGYTERGGAVEDGDAGLEFGGLSVEIPGHEFRAEQLDAVHPLTGRVMRSMIPRGLVSSRLRRW